MPIIDPRPGLMASTPDLAGLKRLDTPAQTDPLIAAIEAKTEEAAAVARSICDGFAIAGDMAKAARFTVAAKALAKIIVENADGDPEDALTHVKLAAQTVAESTAVYLFTDSIVDQADGEIGA